MMSKLMCLGVCLSSVITVLSERSCSSAGYKSTVGLFHIQFIFSRALFNLAFVLPASPLSSSISSFVLYSSCFAVVLRLCAHFTLDSLLFPFFFFLSSLYKAISAKFYLFLFPGMGRDFLRNGDRWPEGRHGPLRLKGCTDDGKEREMKGGSRMQGYERASGRGILDEG